MRFCQSHWDKLRAAVEVRGMGDLVASDGQQAAERLAGELEGPADWSTFDPLMHAHWTIVGNGSDKANYPLIMIDGCPLCWLQDKHDTTCSRPGCTTDYDEWIGFAADGAKQRWDTLAALDGDDR